VKSDVISRMRQGRDSCAAFGSLMLTRLELLGGGDDRRLARAHE
jgi:hypothetical protein